jgi:2-polyprenyl-3-methyl-5-hydroxy-6-metoxy-1,4-benzoquinol methylase
MGANLPAVGVDSDDAEHDYSVFYRRWHDGSEFDYRSADSLYGRLFAQVFDKLPRDARILDLGCGTGLLVRSLIQRGYQSVRGVDTSRTQIEAAQAQRLPCECVGMDWVYSEALKAPGTFDAVFLLDVLEHVPVNQQLALLRSLRALIRPGGVLVVSVPNANSVFGDRWRHNDWTHTSSFTEHSLDYVLLNGGFERVEHLSYEFHTCPRYPWILRPGVFRWMAWRFVRAWRRLEAIAELGPHGRTVPLGLNLLAVAS